MLAIRKTIGEFSLIEDKKRGLSKGISSFFFCKKDWGGEGELEIDEKAEMGKPFLGNGKNMAFKQYTLASVQAASQNVTALGKHKYHKNMFLFPQL